MKEIRDALAQLRADIEGHDLTLGELLDAIGERGYALLVVLFCAIFLSPIPLPGLSTLFGAAVIALGAGLALGAPAWLPASWKIRRVPEKRAIVMLEFAEKILHRAGGWARPRGSWAAHPYFIRFCGAGIVICGIFLALPMPPGGNFVPALGCVLLSIAILARDGLFALYGIIVMMLSGAIVAVVSFAAWRAFQMLLS
ncbi:MAG: exopolysaccharide biosynthesis protein [Candidatus Hydrogenedentota bacterium]